MSRGRTRADRQFLCDMCTHLQLLVTCEGATNDTIQSVAAPLHLTRGDPWGRVHADQGSLAGPTARRLSPVLSPQPSILVIGWGRACADQHCPVTSRHHTAYLAKPRCDQHTPHCMWTRRGYGRLVLQLSLVVIMLHPYRRLAQTGCVPHHTVMCIGMVKLCRTCVL